MNFARTAGVDFSPGAVVMMSWRIENNQLILPPETDSGSERKANLKWLGDNKLKLETSAAVIELARVGDRPDARHPIIGEWVENREMGGRNYKARYLFYPRGEVLLLIPFAVQHGSYTISGSLLHVKMPNRDAEDRFKLADGVLTLSSLEDGQETHYGRY